MFSPADGSVARCLTHQAELGLQLDLERLKGSLELVDLRSGGLKILCARRHLLVQLVELGDAELRLYSSVLILVQAELNIKPNACITLALYQLSMSRRFFSAMVSY